METQTLATKPAIDLGIDELTALLEQKKSQAAEQRNESRRQYERLRDETVTDMVNSANTLKGALQDFKKHVWDNVETLYKLLQEHSNRHADGKGTVTLQTSDGLFRVVYKRHDNTRFDERASQAEKHILDFLTEEFSDQSDPKAQMIRKLLEHKKGRIDKDNVLLLISMKDAFTSQHWRKGVELYMESIVPGETKYYATFEMRFADGEEWKPIVLDFAKL
jgi:hypothetical protein